MTTQQNSESRNFALKALKQAGGFANVAREFDISYAAVRKWADTQRIPSERILRVCQLGKNAVTPHQLNPLVYPEDFRA
jgi:hypothetical protein